MQKGISNHRDCERYTMYFLLIAKDKNGKFRNKFGQFVKPIINDILEKDMKENNNESVIYFN